MPAVEGGILPPGENRKIAQPLTNNQLLVLAERLPPGWKRRLYGRQDARRYDGRARGGDGLWMAHVFLGDYGRVPEKIIRAHSALGWEGRGYWGKAGLKIGNWQELGRLIK